MNRKRLYFSILLFAMLGCRSRQILERSDKYYYDIDFTSLKGVGPMVEVHYPAILVDSLGGGKRKVILCYSNKIQDSAEYQYLNNSWRTHYTFWADTTEMTVYTNIFRDKITWLKYKGADSTTGELSSFSIFENNQEVTYGLKQTIIGTVGDLDSIAKRVPMNMTLADTFVIKNGVLFKFSKREDNLYSEVVRDTVCFPIKDRSIFWWLLFEKYIDEKDKGCK